MDSSCMALMSKLAHDTATTPSAQLACDPFFSGPGRGISVRMFQRSTVAVPLLFACGPVTRRFRERICPRAN